LWVVENEKYYGVASNEGTRTKFTLFLSEMKVTKSEAFRITTEDCCYKYVQGELKVSSCNMKLEIFDLVKDKQVPGLYCKTALHTYFYCYEQFNET
jgi:hypothetical protein